MAKEKYLDMRGDRDERMQLADLLNDVAPNNYRTREWGELRRVRTQNRGFRWLCPEHVEKYRV